MKAAKKAAPKSKPKAAEAVALIKKIYDIESEVRGEDPPVILAARQKRAEPLMRQFKQWLDAEQLNVLPKSLLGRAVNYALGQWDKMQVFLSNLLVPGDNNQTEGAIRPFVIGRKGWLFSASVSGAKASMAIYSLVESAKANRIDPFDYLKLVFKELARDSSRETLERLLPNKITLHYTLKSFHPTF